MGCDTITPILKPVEVVAEHQHEMVAQRRAQKIGDCSAAGEFYFRLGATEIFGVAGSQDFAFRKPQSIHLFAADAQQGDRSSGECPLNPNTQPRLEV